MVPRAWIARRIAFYSVALACFASDYFVSAESNAMNLTSLLGWTPRLTFEAPGQFNITLADDAPDVYQLFNMGLMLIYNFDQRNAKLVFQEASRLSPGCAMCSWGFAHASGPTLNVPVKSAAELRAGDIAAKEAMKLLERKPESYTPKEQVLIRSMSQRYEVSSHPQPVVEAARRYSERLQTLREELDAKDVDLKVFQAEALMLQLCSPNEWHFYRRDKTDTPVAMPETLESTKMLREVLEITNQTHPYAQHLLIHSTEMSNSEALTALSTASHLLADTAHLQDQHLQHMTSHTYLRTGHYHKALMSNVVALGSDSAYLQHHWMPYGPGHNSVFLVCCALWGGEKAAAYKYVRVVQEVFETAPAQSDFPDGSMAWNYPLLVALRFGDWQQVWQLQREAPQPYGSKWLYGGPFLLHFAQSIASAHLGKPEAMEHLMQLRQLMPAIAKAGQYTSESLIANHTASAVLAMQQDHVNEALEALGTAVEVEMAMPYGLPPNWLLPTRECYGHALFLAKRFREAERIFRQALVKDSFHAEPNCGWALLGLRRSLAAQGGHDAEVKSLAKDIAKAWEFADVPLSSPCTLIDLGPLGPVV